MTQIAANLLPMGAQAPDFRLSDVVSGKTYSLEDFAGKKALLVMFLCRHCPFVVHVQQELARIGADYLPQGVGIVAIGANDVGTHPNDSPEHLKAQAEEQNFPFPYLYDESQETAKAYTAIRTPDIFVFDGGGRLVYRGQLDDSRPSNDIPVNGRDLRAVLDAVLAGHPVPADQKPSVGCTIKWRPGNVPSYVPQ
jgi:peroxiredoxin